MSEDLQAEVERLTNKVAELYKGAEEQKQRIKRLEDAGDAMAAILNNTRKDWYTSDQCEVSAFNWNEAKEAKL